jgi:hypothetical protein
VRSIAIPIPKTSDMKWIRDLNGQPRRLWMEDGEIESITLHALQKAGLQPTRAQPVADLEALAEIHLDLRVDYNADLPASVLGVTEIRADGSLKISINRDLTASFEAEGAGLGDRGRWRATLAHELAHVLFHRELFPANANQVSLLDSLHTAEPIRCYKKAVNFHSAGDDWREFQANRGMAALLMPRALFVSAFDEIRRGDDPVGCVPSLIIEELAERFEVSRQAARIRAEHLRLFTGAAQRLI